MVHITPVASLLGGMLIGLASALLLIVLGRVAGISGIFAALLGPDIRNKRWQFAFVAGLVAGGFVLATAAPHLFTVALDRSWLTIAVAGFLVGVGTRLGNGCTSGHGVCGVGRGSRRSIVATLVFVGTGILTVLVVDNGLGVLR